jgi:hypothetical protein
MGDMRNSYKVLVGKLKKEGTRCQTLTFSSCFAAGCDQVPWYLSCKICSIRVSVSASGKTLPSAILSTTDLAWSVLGQTLGLLNEKTATNLSQLCMTYI